MQTEVDGCEVDAREEISSISSASLLTINNELPSNHEIHDTEVKEQSNDTPKHVFTQPEEGLQQQQLWQERVEQPNDTPKHVFTQPEEGLQQQQPWQERVEQPNDTPKHLFAQPELWQDRKWEAENKESSPRRRNTEATINIENSADLKYEVSKK